MIPSEFFPPHEGMRLADFAGLLELRLADPAAADRVVKSVAPIYRGAEGDVCYILNRKNRAELDTCRATAIICGEDMAPLVPDHIAVLVAKDPQVSFARAGGLLHPGALKPAQIVETSGVSPLAVIHPDAQLEEGVSVEPYAVIGAHASIGAGTQILASAVIGAHVKIGRNCSVGSHATVVCAYIGNDVIIHSGVRIGQDGFGYAPGPRGSEKIVQIGRVIVQDKVEVGANSTIDRGTMDDTVIGEGTKIDNSVMIGHNVKVGRHCIIVAGVGIAGSTKIGNGVLIGGKVGVAGHISIGDGAQIAAMTGVATDLAAGGKYGGIPARPIKDFLRDSVELMAKSEMKKRKGKKAHE
ncbi:UDP-3-O-(3-hydroxymyristoyl)glucosamine N-acyltransferase [Rhizobium sp.]